MKGSELNNNLTTLKTNFQAGVDALYNKCVECGVTPVSKTPTSIADAIQSIYTNNNKKGIMVSFFMIKDGVGTSGQTITIPYGDSSEKAYTNPDGTTSPIRLKNITWIG